MLPQLQGHCVVVVQKENPLEKEVRGKQLGTVFNMCEITTQTSTAAIDVNPLTII